MLSLAAEDYFYKDEFDVVKRFITLYNLHPKEAPAEGVTPAEGVQTTFETKGFIEKTEICEWFYQGMPNTTDEIKENRVINQDFFGPWSIHEEGVYPINHKKNGKGEENEVKKVRNFVDLKDFGVTFEEIVFVNNVQEFKAQIAEIKKWPYLALDFEFVPTTIIGQVQQLALLQVAGYDPENPEAHKMWVFDLLKPSNLSSLCDESIPRLDEAEYTEMIKLVLDEVIGNVTSTKLGIGVINDVENLKIACGYPKEKKIVRNSFNQIKFTNFIFSH